MSNGRRWRRARRPVLAIVPAIPDDAPAHIKNGLAIRNTATVTGKCPHCKAVAEITRMPQPGEIGHAVMEHEDDCPALLEEATR